MCDHSRVVALSGHLLDKLDAIAQKVLQSTLPFGGLQLVFCGDFLQLPPVEKRQAGDLNFAFDAKCWGTAIAEHVQLTQVFRQSDNTFVKLLNQIRVGQVCGMIGISQAPLASWCLLSFAAQGGGG